MSHERNPQFAGGFDEFFHRATGSAPFPFQRDLASACLRPKFQSYSRSEEHLPALVDVPTGLGKTAMAVLGWLWRRRFAAGDVRRATPRRLVYCLPMRVLVEQTRDNTIRWLYNCDQLAGTVVVEPSLANGERATDRHRITKYAPPVLSESRDGQTGRIAVHVLLGGEDESEWYVYPERDAIIIGTQDMLLSRALNRGYAASRARWPMHFGLLNTDCLWVFDEVQLMGCGLATTAQLEAFRRQLAGQGGAKDNGCASVWMSATLRSDWLKTVDFKDRIDDQGRIDGKTTLSLSDADHKDPRVAARWNATKLLKKANATIDERNAAKLAVEVHQAHKPGTRTIVVVNTVRRACLLHDSLEKAASESVNVKVNGKSKKGKQISATVPAPVSEAASSPASAETPKLVLLHSRFRPPDRAKRIAEALAEVDRNGPAGPGTIIVSTQVIEAGVDVSATTLFTELAPWASLVQRFGRCNRRGELNGTASVHWIDLPAKDADAERTRHPYELADLRVAAAELGKLNDVGPGSLAAHRRDLEKAKLGALFPHRHTHVIRRKDLLDLFDATPDLTGNDIDIDRYVREVEETDVRVFWRNYGDAQKQAATPNDINGEGRAGGERRVEPSPLRDELCPAPIGEFKEYAKKAESRGRVWRWNFTERVWERAEPEAIAPGQVFLVHKDAGGYSAERGWSGKSDDIPSLDEPTTHNSSDEVIGHDDDRESQSHVWQTIAEHTRDVCSELDRLMTSLEMFADAALPRAARWHDWGKAHEVFQGAVKKDGRPAEFASLSSIAKAPRGFWSRYVRHHFRHELASALAVLQRPHDDLKSLSEDDLNLVAYLIAAHHGKVRLSIRSMPNEQKPSPRTHRLGGVPRERRFARGVRDGDMLPSVDLGGGVVAPTVTLSLETMEMGICETEPFVGQPSWMERVLRLRDRLGPFRLAYLEAVLRAADARASAHAAASAKPKPTEVSHA
jgi:CRISPR-associated endonuclease/helicase Cas3